VSDATVDAPSKVEVAELSSVDAQLETQAASKAIEWALTRFGKDVALAASFQDVVLIDLAVAIEPRIEVIFLDTGAHFEETLSFVDEVTSHYALNLTVTHPGPEADAFACGSPRCCEFRKVAPLRAALAGKSAWLTALKRVDAPTRAAAPIVSWDEGFGLVKVNPMAKWTDEDIASYVADHDLLVHPLVSQGYVSIGCAPTTRPVAPGEDPRSGRWSGSDKVECGLHA